MVKIAIILYDHFEYNSKQTVCWMVFTSLRTYLDSSNFLLTFVSEGKICSKNELELLHIVKRSTNEFRKMSAEKATSKYN